MHKNGGIRWFLARGTVFRDADGRPYRMVGTDTEVTERKRADEAVRRVEAKFRAVFEANFVPLCFWHEATHPGGQRRLLTPDRLHVRNSRLAKPGTTLTLPEEVSFY